MNEMQGKERGRTVRPGDPSVVSSQVTRSSGSGEVLVAKIHASGVREVFDVARAESAAVMTCGVCGRSWDDAVASGVTPVPAGRCPFESGHPEVTPQVTDVRAMDLIAELLSGVAWSAGTLDEIALVVCATGREIDPP